MLRERLEDYHFPQDLKTMTPAELDLLAVQIREFLIRNVSETGGHLASNLGVVELTIALHRVFDSPDDKIIWDVGHQAYVHKILTGRAGQFATLRQTGGLSGFPKRHESIHDCFETGHSSTSLSAAEGFAAARDLTGAHYQVAAVIGDGSLTGGMAYEALNNIGAKRSKMIIVINDNGMSISRNIGGVSRHLGKLRTDRRYLNAKRDVREKLEQIPTLGPEISNIISESKSWLKYALIRGGVIFEELGFTYLGPISGHDITKLTEALRSAEDLDRPVVLHVITKKGKGYYPAEKDPDRFHGIGPFDPETGALREEPERTFSDAMGSAAVELAEKDGSITAITAAMRSGVGLDAFAMKYPKRFFDVGIAEAHAVTFAAGLAAAGMHPLVAVYDSFLQRAFDQITEDVCLQDLPVVFAVDRAGIVGADGETHHGLYDLCVLRSLPNAEILAPADEAQLRAMMDYAFRHDHPVFIRYPRGKCRLSDAAGSAVQDGCGAERFAAPGPDLQGFGNIRITSGKDVDLFAVGTELNTAAAAAEILRGEGISAGLVDVRSVKPFDRSVFDGAAARIATLEDGAVRGGFGEGLRADAPKGTDILSFGWPDEFIPQGSTEDLRKAYGLDAASIAERIRETIEGKA